jgi:hypothetical protein
MSADIMHSKTNISCFTRTENYSFKTWQQKLYFGLYFLFSSALRSNCYIGRRVCSATERAIFMNVTPQGETQSVCSAATSRIGSL